LNIKDIKKKLLNKRKSHWFQKLKEL
jgi:hypothetical protein